MDPVFLLKYLENFSGDVKCVKLKIGDEKQTFQKSLKMRIIGH